MKYNRVYDEGSADITIQWKKNIGSHLGAAIFKSYIEISYGGDTCYGQWKPFDDYTISLIMWHEFGHSMGYQHSPNQNNIMYRSVAQQFDIDFESSFNLDEGAIQPIRLCGGNLSYSVSTNEKNQGFSVYALTPGTDPSSFITKGEGKHYSNCMNKNIISGSGSCSVSQGSTLVLYNKDDWLKFNTMNISLKIDQQNQNTRSVDWKWDPKGFAYDVNWLNDVISKYRN